ncbi:hypothetical protein ABIE45_005588 [Methylobacterium sp. OAE515]|uniref:hypothetical protein n=1 Tax=Methylobacterium sp. OAE515 TaxID=2817895 RepID=UPI00178BC287
MNQAFYDPASGQVWMTVGGQLQPYAPATLVAAIEAGRMISVRRIVGGGLLAMADASTFVDCDGTAIGDGPAVVAYLNGEFSREPAVVPGPRGPGIFSGSGDPDAAFGMAGDLYLDAATGNLFTKET